MSVIGRKFCQSNCLKYAEQSALKKYETKREKVIKEGGNTVKEELKICYFQKILLQTSNKRG